MECIEFSDEIITISVAVGRSLEGTDRVTDANVMSHVFDGHHLPQGNHQPSQAFRVVAKGLDLRQDRIQNLPAATAFQSKCSDEQHGPIQADPRCMHNSIKRTPMNHIPVAAFRTPVT